MSKKTDQKRPWYQPSLRRVAVTAPLAVAGILGYGLQLNRVHPPNVVRYEGNNIRVVDGVDNTGINTATLNGTIASKLPRSRLDKVPNVVDKLELMLIVNGVMDVELAANTADTPKAIETIETSTSAQDETQIANLGLSRSRRHPGSTAFLSGRRNPVGL